MSICRILTFDGGGIAGLFTAVIMQRLVRECPGLIENTELLAGTSTGGIIALALAAGESPDRLVSLYRDRADEIFQPDLLDAFNPADKLFRADHSNRGLRRELESIFGDKTLGDLNKRVLICSFCLDSSADMKPETPEASPKFGPRTYDAAAALTPPRTWKPKFFHNFPGPDSDARQKIVDVALRTSAAPTYFPTAGIYIDGGVVANNPSMAAIAQALDPSTGEHTLDEIHLLSIGTGVEPRFVKGRDHNWGILKWAPHLITLMISGSMGVADYQCRRLLRDRYRRINEVMPQRIDLDETNPEALETLVTAAAAFDLQATLEWLIESWS